VCVCDCVLLPVAWSLERGISYHFLSKFVWSNQSTFRRTCVRGRCAHSARLRQPKSPTAASETPDVMTTSARFRTFLVFRAAVVFVVLAFWIFLEMSSLLRSHPSRGLLALAYCTSGSSVGKRVGSWDGTTILGLVRPSTRTTAVLVSFLVVVSPPFSWLNWPFFRVTAGLSLCRRRCRCHRCHPLEPVPSCHRPPTPCQHISKIFEGHEGLEISIGVPHRTFWVNSG